MNLALYNCRNLTIKSLSCFISPIPGCQGMQETPADGFGLGQLWPVTPHTLLQLAGLDYDLPTKLWTLALSGEFHLVHSLGVPLPQSQK